MEPRVKSLIPLAALGVLTFGSSVMARDGGSLDPVGTWLVEDGRAKIHIEKCGAEQNGICGSVVWMKDPLDEKGHPKTDIKNPDPVKRGRPALGMQIIKELKPDDDQVYSGQIYNAENGKDYDVTLKVEKPGELRLKGCVLSILCQSQHWTRVADLPSTVVATTQKTKSKAASPAE
jgi:uncharacterized protein (DUF2147 family)